MVWQGKCLLCKHKDLWEHGPLSPALEKWRQENPGGSLVTQVLSEIVSEE